MAKITNPVRFSDHLGIDSALLNAAGVLNPSLNVDTGLFIDPLLLGSSQHPEIKDGARPTYEAHFTTVIKLLRVTKAVGDVAWRSAFRHLSFSRRSKGPVSATAHSLSPAAARATT